MAGAYTVINLSNLPAPNVVEALDFETIVSEMIADLQARDSTFTALLESDPAYKIIEVCAYRELLLRQRVNDSAKAVMLAFAEKADLDQIGANVGVKRLMIDPGDPEAIPPIAPTYELDTDFRSRIQLSPEGYTTAGSEGSYVFHAIGSDPDVWDVQPVSPAPGQVTVYVLSRIGDGTASNELLETVNGVLNAQEIRPMTDQVTVLSAMIVPYTISATLTFYPGPDSAPILAAAIEALQAYCDSVRRIGYDVTLSGIYKALHQPGVQSVELASPTANIVIGDGQSSRCTSMIVTAAGSTDV